MEAERSHCPPQGNQCTPCTISHRLEKRIGGHDESVRVLDLVLPNQSRHQRALGRVEDSRERSEGEGHYQDEEQVETERDEGESKYHEASRSHQVADYHHEAPVLSVDQSASDKAQGHCGDYARQGQVGDICRRASLAVHEPVQRDQSEGGATDRCGPRVEQSSKVAIAHNTERVRVDHAVGPYLLTVP